MNSNRISNLSNALEAFSANNNPFYNGDFFHTWMYSDKGIQSIIDGAVLIENMYARNISLRCFESGLAVSNFRDQSTRTRFSFASAANMLGLAQQDLDESKSQISHGETVRETAAMISFFTEVIGIRDDMYIHEGHRYMKEVADSLDESFQTGILHQRPSVLNLQCDYDHPTQSCADLVHLIDYFGSVENLRGKKLAMTWAYSPSYGKPLSVPQGIITLMSRFGMNISLAHPEGYDLMPETLETASRHASISGGSFQKVSSMKAAFQDADIVYPKSWAPYDVMEKRTALLRKGDATGLKKLEKECLAANARHKNWECDSKMMKLTKNKRALYMHCLPADISGVSCSAGEVSADVFERYRLDTYFEASHKPAVIASMMLHTRFQNPGDVLLNMFRRQIPRRLT